MKLRDRQTDVANALAAQAEAAGMTVADLAGVLRIAQRYPDPKVQARVALQHSAKRLGRRKSGVRG